MNEVRLSGHVQQEPMCKTYGKQENMLVVIELAVQGWKDRKDIFEVSFFDKRAEMVAEHLQAGDFVMIYGTLKSTAYQDHNGITRRSISIVGKRFEKMPPNVQDMEIAEPMRDFLTYDAENPSPCEIYEEITEDDDPWGAVSC